jgi:hypothetical protein
MSKKGATNSGGTAGRKRAKDSAMASRLGPSPASWNYHAELFPYHANKGTVHRPPSGGEPLAKRRRLA